MLPYVLSLVKDKNDRLFCISGDIYVSEDGGISWNILDYGIENKNISSLGVDNLGNVYAGTSYTGTYKLVDTPVSVENSNENIINDFGLLQNYPNPFNPTTIIYFRLPVSGFVTLKVYDILGREVALLLNENKLAGNYEVEFNAKNIPSGVYFYTLSVGEFKETRKMLFMK
ncbi:MAG: T9SS type A sorting domain-containing protein [Ignavibacteriales bacterium]|nr:T9SS type A sorting domain-containing protein [Ignavibacteriales bacterium]